MHYLVTGHTGFKGAWLTMLLASRGHTVSGLALAPVPGALYETANLGELMHRDLRIDVRHASPVSDAVRDLAPDVVLHLAAQPLVRESYRSPRETFETNVMGTLNVLEAVANTPQVKAQVIVTTDKVYRNVGQAHGYVETDALGGHDPYSSSKAMADLLTQSWVSSFPGTPTAIARAGNVIGGGDVSADRLLPDLLRSFASTGLASIRFPDAVRPWQHVLDCLTGYLDLTEALLHGAGHGEWNFGPGPDSFVTVGKVADKATEFYGESARWGQDGSEQPHEAQLLALDASRAQSELGWRNKLPFADSVRWTVDWQKRYEAGESPRVITQTQIDHFAHLN